MKPEESIKINLGAELQGARPYLKAELERLIRATINQVMSRVTAGTLTPEVAVLKWMEVVSYRRLLSNIDQQVTAGQTVGEKVADDLSII